MSGSCPYCVVCLVFVSCFYVCFVFEHMALSLLLSAMYSSCPASLLLVDTPPCLVLFVWVLSPAPLVLSCLSECCHLSLSFSLVRLSVVTCSSCSPVPLYCSPFPSCFASSLCYVSVCLCCLTSPVIPLIPYLVVCRFCLLSRLILSCPADWETGPLPVSATLLGLCRACDISSVEWSSVECLATAA